RGGAEALSFNSYFDFLEKVFCNTGDIVDDEFRKRMKRIRKDSALPFIDTESYRALKVATEAFVMVKIESDRNDLGGYLETVTDSSGAETDMIPYLAIIRRKLGDVDFKQATFGKTFRKFLKKEKVETNCYGLIVDKLRNPIYLELIWSYWMEESMMVQGMNSICRRFQNIRSSDVRDPLAHLEIGPLRPLNNILWGYVQDEQHRLSVKRRAYEYDHHYGLTLQGKAVAGLRPADTRSKFIQAFHSLLNMTCKFYKQFDDKTIEADAFPLLNALKEVHLILSEGAHNQYGDLPSTARIEMMMQQYILARPEFREFLPTRQMVAYPEPWMDRVATLNTMMGWTPTSVMHFRDLAYFGEQILLSIRFGAWTTTFTRENAANWAIAWRSEIQNYIHSYRAVTGADLSIESGPVDIHQPSMHMMRIVREQSRKSA
ncbi:MAG: 8-amino-7-oxononanoate synthase, partial [Bacteroidota bacterium]